MISASLLSLTASLLLSSSLTTVDQDFLNRQDELSKEYFGVFNDSTLTQDELRAMHFLYAYMPLPDLAGYPANFHLANVRSSLRARQEMPWGYTIPDREFLHFVLPVRVNNEALDLSRPRFYDELKDRVNGLSMKDAILEVNHWCHEHVTYKASDGRTSSPLSTMSQAIGRCGEESTFTVAALRAVGIPARQIYTPRWAHTDDNHAWVEAWADGEWFFFGACEPAPVLDMAWFNAPATRGVLMTTNVFGKYDGPEEKISINPLSTAINVTSKYAPVDTLNVVVTDINGMPVPDARVAFTVYNYAEFSPVALKRCDLLGHASLTGGLGDFVIWATDGKRFGYSKGNPKQSDILTIVLDKDTTYTGNFDLTIVPPHLGGALPNPPEELVKENDRRLTLEDSIRKAYESTFVSEEEALKLAKIYAPGSAELINIIKEARGNSKALSDLIKSLSPDRREKAIALLGAVTEKDRRDIPMEVILDCLNHTDGDVDDPLFVNYILCPRIDEERLVPFREAFIKALGKERLEQFRSNPEALREWVVRDLSVETRNNPAGLYYDPVTVLRTMTADPISRDVFYVAVARTAGIASRLEPVTFKVQIQPQGAREWIDVNLDNSPETEETVGKGYLNLTYKQVGRNINPRYYTQFTISRITDGLPVPLEYGDEDGWKEISERNEPLDAGQYILISGQRLADGSVLSHSEIFTIKKDETTTIPLILRDDPTAVQVIGALNAENLYRPIEVHTPKSLLSTAGRGYYVVGIIQPNHEPSAHSINDLSSVKDELEEAGREIIVLFSDEDSANRFDKNMFVNLPTKLSFGVDINGMILNELKESLNLTSTELPIFVIADSFNRVVYFTQGYTIGLGERLLDTLSKIE